MRCQKDCGVFLLNENENGMCSVKTTNSSRSTQIKQKENIGYEVNKKAQAERIERKTLTNRTTKQKHFHLVTADHFNEFYDFLFVSVRVEYV